MNNEVRKKLIESLEKSKKGGLNALPSTSTFLKLGVMEGETIEVTQELLSKAPSILHTVLLFKAARCFPILKEDEEWIKEEFKKRKIIKWEERLEEILRDSLVCYKCRKSRWKDIEEIVGGQTFDLYCPHLRYGEEDTYKEYISGYLLETARAIGLDNQSFKWDRVGEIRVSDLTWFTSRFSTEIGVRVDPIIEEKARIWRKI